MPPPPLIIWPSGIFLTQYALLSRKLAHKMFIFHDIFRLASLANQDNQETYKFKRSNYFTSLILKVSVLVQNIRKVCNQLFNTQSPSLFFKKFKKGHSSTHSLEKELSCRQSFSSKLVQNITIMHIFYQNFSGGGPQAPLLPYSSNS